MAYIKRQSENRQRNVRGAIAIAKRQLRRLEAPRPSTGSKGGKSGSSTSSVLQAATLNSKINQLESQLSVVGVRQVKPARPGTAVLLSPHPKKNAIFGFVIGIVLAAIAAFALSRFNRRLRTLGDVEAVLQVPILTALPKVRRPVIRREGEPAPARPLVEPIRRLHTTLLLGHMREQEQQVSPRSVLFVSADSGDGKSTVVADLALVAREGGEHVAVIEADFRRPVQSALLGVGTDRGLGDVLTGRLGFREALQVVPSVHAEAVANGGGAGATMATTTIQSHGVGSIAVLASGPSVQNPPALLARQEMIDLLRTASEEFDRVLIDAPSPLEVSDVMPLLGSVDAIALVARAGHTRERSAQRLQQILMRTPTAPVVGAVANVIARADMVRYGMPGGQPARRWPAALIAR